MLVTSSQIVPAAPSLPVGLAAQLEGDYRLSLAQGLTDSPYLLPTGRSAILHRLDSQESAFEIADAHWFGLVDRYVAGLCQQASNAACSVQRVNIDRLFASSPGANPKLIQSPAGTQPAHSIGIRPIGREELMSHLKPRTRLSDQALEVRFEDFAAITECLIAEETMDFVTIMTDVAASWLRYGIFLFELSDAGWARLCIPACSFLAAGLRCFFDNAYRSCLVPGAISDQDHEVLWRQGWRPVGQSTERQHFKDLDKKSVGGAEKCFVQPLTYAAHDWLHAFRNKP